MGLWLFSAEDLPKPQWTPHTEAGLCAHNFVMSGMDLLCNLLCVMVWWCQYACASVCDSSADVISPPLGHGQASLAARGREGKGRTEGIVGHASIYNTEHFGLAFVAGQL